MSDTIVHSPGPDRNRTIASLAAALVIHVAVLLVISIFARLDMAGAAQTPTVIDVQLQGGPGGKSAGPLTPSGGSPAAAAVASGLPSASSSGGGGGYVIPTPSGRSTESSALPTGPSFQTGGARTGVAESLPSVPSEPQPTVTVGQKGKTTGAGPTSGSGSAQRGGQGVLVTGSTGKTGSDSLDLSQLDKAMTGSGTGSRGSAAGGGSGTASSGSGTGGGGAGTGTGGGGAGTGTGGGGAGGGAAAGGAGSGGDSVEWKQPASRGRILLDHPAPNIPTWVSDQGLTLSVRVSFTLLPNGTVSTASIQRSTGYADVDSSVVDAIRHWRFSAAKGGGAVKGVIPYIIKTR